jgi:hypothetical protein
VVKIFISLLNSWIQLPYTLTTNSTIINKKHIAIS